MVTIKAYIKHVCQKHSINLEDGFVEQLDTYLSCLEAWGQVHNLTAVKEKKEQVDILLLPSLGLNKYLVDYKVLIDLGSGGGFPGIVCAITNPEKEFRLVEKSPRKCSFLRYIVHKLALKNTKVLATDFSTMPVDKSVDALLTRGSCKINQQRVLTKDWLDQGTPLLSIQSEASLQKYKQIERCSVHTLPVASKKLMLKLVIISKA